MAPSAVDHDRRFAELYTEYKLPVTKFVYAKLKISSEAEVEDIVHDVFVNVYEHLGDWRDVGIPIVHWIFRIARNTMINWTRRPKTSNYMQPGTEGLDTIVDPSTEIDFAEAESGEIMARVMAGLSERDRLVIHYRYVHGLELEQISERLATHGYHVTPETMRVVHPRALARARRILNGNPPRRTGRPAQVRAS